MDNVEQIVYQEEETRVQARHAWDSCLSLIRERTKPLTFKTWFEPVRALKLENGVLTLQVPSSFFYEWIEEHYNPLLTQSIQQTIGPDARIDYLSLEEDGSAVPIAGAGTPVNGEEEEDSLRSTTFSVLPPRQIPKLAPVQPLDENEAYRATNLNQKYTFDNFVRGDGNQFACAAALNIANNLGSTSFNPLVIYGGVGLGKTHLIQAIGNAAFEKNPRLNLVYMSSEKFTIEFVEAIEKNRTKEFSDYFRSMDILIIDDIQFFSGKERTQDNFFHTFNTLHQAKRQIVLSSDRPPKEITGLSERLISRFQWGLTVDIQPPDLETRIAILRMKSEQDSITLPRDVLEFIAANVKSNIRELEGCYITLIARHTFDQRPIDLPLAEEVLRSVTSTFRKQLSVEQIQKLVSDHFGISENLLRAKTRKQEIVLARQVAMYLAKTFTSASLKTIGLHFGGRDHSTVIHACQTVSASLNHDPAIRDAVKQLEKQLNLISA